MDVLLEIHNESELEDIQSLKNVKLIGINNRDLHTFETNTHISERLKPIALTFFPKAKIIAESGYKTQEQIQELEENQFDGVLIGEGLFLNKKLINSNLG